MTLPTVQATGNLTADPELRFTKSGDAVATLRLATNRSRKTESGWETTHTTYLTVKLWRQDAESAAEHLRKGDRVVVSGELLIEEWEGKDGGKRQTPTLDRATVAKLLPRGQASSQQWAPSSEVAPF